MKIEIDVEQFANDLSIGGANGALGSLIKQLTEAALAAEIDSHLAKDLSNNRRNGYSSKTMKSEIEDKILSLFALGNSYCQTKC